MIVKTEAIVLKSFDYRETSRIATFFTKNHGKVSGILKGIRKDPRKFGSSVDKFSVNDIVYYRYRNSELHLISHCDLRQFFYPARQDLKKSMAAQYILELVNKIMPVEHKSPKIYTLMINFLNGLETATDIHQLVHIFQIKTLLYSGFRPHLDSCLMCHKKIVDSAYFSAKEGGLICSHCPLSQSEKNKITKGSIASLLHIEKSSWENCLKLRLTDVTQKEFKYILNHFLEFHLGRRIQTAKYLN